jgi:pimeloyl-ACP methyl ester carboxylesterase
MNFLDAYDAVLARWPVPVESVDVPSAFGTTRVQVCGPDRGTPLVLLHGGGATSTVWFANVEALSRDRRVYAVDQLGDAGRSVHDGQPLATRADLMAWLHAVFAELDLKRIHLAGHSYGGWLALNYALDHPDRTARLALLDPTKCFGGMRPGYLLHAVPLFARPSAARMRAFLDWETGGAAIDAGWRQVMELGLTVPRSKIVMPSRPPAERLRACTVPTLVLLAGRSRSNHVRRTAHTARRLLPHVDVRVLPNVSHHMIPTEHAGELNQALTTFLAAPARPAAHPADPPT